jgi:hypothetical protein
VDLERRKRLLVIVTIICVGAWMADNFVIAPMTNLWQERSARIQELTDDMAKNSGLVDREDSLKARWEDMRKRALPTRVSDAENAVFQGVNEWTSDSSLVVTALKPRWTRMDRDKQTLEIQLEGSGNIEAVTRFVYDLEGSPLPLRIEDKGITSQDEKGGRLNLSLRFTGLVIEEVSP